MYNTHALWLRKTFPYQRRKVGQDVDAYLAGFLDGEGSVTFHVWSSKKPWSTEIRVSAYNTVREPIELFRRVYGGNIKTLAKKPRRRDCFAWTAHGKDALWALCRMLPWLRLKRQKARLACTILLNRPVPGGAPSHHQKIEIMKALNKFRRECGTL